MKYLAFLFFSLISTKALAGCFVDLTRENISLNVERLSESEKAGGNHGYMNTLKIQVLSEYKGAPLETMLLTKGEVAEFWFPIAFTVTDGIATTTLTGYEESLEDLEMAFFYTDKECTLSTQIML
ncbi:hypothetical protein ACUR5C_09725 [Aliikangiella sp. IMCC44653]